MRKPLLAAVVTVALMACGLDVVGTEPAGTEIVGDAGSVVDAGTREDARTSPADAPDAGLDAPDVADASEVTDANPCASCTGAVARQQCVNQACVEVRRVFVTSAKWTGKLGGLTGADEKCRLAAQAAGLGGQWRAWLSDNNSSPFTRFEKSSVPYRRVDGTIVANDWNDLVDGNLAANIQLDENGVLVVADDGVEVWTGTKENGDRLDPICNGFVNENSNQNGRVGVADQSSKIWTSIYEKTCDANLRLYCFEQ